ncbi:hypothetical protein CEXT_281381 [Caerostris extrusa]|uniref:Uncharacterized protein n=1 Tax=Caerostris extrusa TaxID=172846 RepID=A0AAV4Y1Z9_CAEEX|nr:hypothetical protein CEXT_281381 [Caerostris extrusa]
MTYNSLDENSETFSETVDKILRTFLDVEVIETTFPDFFRGKNREFSVEGWNKKKNSGHFNRSWGYFEEQMEHQECDFRFKMPVQPDTQGSEMLDMISPV